jgi:hypothetical protein
MTCVFKYAYQPQEGKQRCELCGRNFHNANDLAAHNNGKKHRECEKTRREQITKEKEELKAKAEAEAWEREEETRRRQDEDDMRQRRVEEWRFVQRERRERVEMRRRFYEELRAWEEAGGSYWD